jgi:hypothetical protein
VTASYLAYCDESGQRDYGPKTDRYFVVAGVLAPALDAPHLEDEIRGLKRAFWGNPDIEIKSNWIRQPEQRQKHYTAPHGIELPDINALISALYRWLPKSGLVVVAGVVDKPLMQQKYKKPHYAGAVSYTMFLQRFQKYLSKRRATGSVVFDDPAGKSPGGYEWRTLLQRQHNLLKKNGCPYTSATFPDVGPITFSDSKATTFIQIADLIAYNTFRQFRAHGKEWEDSSVAKFPMYEHFHFVAHLFDLGPHRRLDGYGIAKWPIGNKVARYLTVS